MSGMKDESINESGNKNEVHGTFRYTRRSAEISRLLVKQAPPLFPADAVRYIKLFVKFGRPSLSPTHFDSTSEPETGLLHTSSPPTSAPDTGKHRRLALAWLRTQPTLGLTQPPAAEAQRHDAPYHVVFPYISEVSKQRPLLPSPSHHSCSGSSSLTTIISAIMPGLTLAPISVPLCDAAPRKRTMSFSNTHAPRSSRSLTRTASYISLPDARTDSYTLKVGSTSSHRHDTHSAPYPRPPKPHKERRKSQPRSSNEPLTILIKPRATKPPPSKPSPVPMSGLRVSSPLAPTRSILPPRANFPRSKAEPDLYRVAIIGCMRRSPEGQKILHMGPRLAMSIYSATQELEKIVASQRDYEGDVNMTGEDGQVLSTSWVVVPQEDWEMIES